MSVADSTLPRPEVLLARVDLALEVGEFEQLALELVATEVAALALPYATS